MSVVSDLSLRRRGDAPGRATRHFAALAALAIAAGVMVGAAPNPTGPPRSPTPRSEMFLSWHAPYGTPGATDHLTAACDDTTAVDTLFVSFRPGRSHVSIFAIEAVLLFHPPPGETLGPFWHFKRHWENEYNLLVDFDVIAGVHCVPWRQTGYGRVAYDHRSGRGRLDLAFAVEPDLGQGLNAEETFCIARVRIQHRRSGLEGCKQAVCVELAHVIIDPQGGTRHYGITLGQHRFVSWNGDGASTCASRHGAERMRAWRPPAAAIGSTPAALNPPSVRDTAR